MITISDVVLFMVLALAVFSAVAEPTHKASGQGVEIVIHSEACAFKDIVGNLPYRATWHEQGRTFEGCGGFHPVGVAMFWFSDKTVFPLPAQYFVKVVGA